MAPCQDPSASSSFLPAPSPTPVLVQILNMPDPANLMARQNSPAFTAPASTGPLFATSSGEAAASAVTTTADLFPNPTSTPTGSSTSGTGFSGLPSDVFVWIFVLVASGLVVLTGLYRVWRLRQLNRSMATFFRPLHPGMTAPPRTYAGYGGRIHVLAADPTYYNTPHYPYAPYLSPPPPAAHPSAGRATRVNGADVGEGGRRGATAGYGEAKEELPAYERSTLPGYGEVVGGRWEDVELSQLGTQAGEAPPPPITPPPEERPVHETTVDNSELPITGDLPTMEDLPQETTTQPVTQQPTGSTNPFRA